MMKARHAERRQARESRAAAERALTWTPPARTTLDHVDPYAFACEDPRLTIEVRMWTRDGRLADFYAKATWHDPHTFVRPTMIASMDCLHHGSIHFHDELRDPEHAELKPFAPLRRLEDLAENFDTAIDAFIDFAAMIARREGMTR